jgi:hypothetical protein
MIGRPLQGRLKELAASLHGLKLMAIRGASLQGAIWSAFQLPGVPSTCETFPRRIREAP